MKRWWVRCGEEVTWEALAVLGACNVGACTVLPSKHPRELRAPLGLLPLSFLGILHLPSWLGGKRSLLAAQGCSDHCYVLSWGQSGVWHRAPAASGTMSPASGHEVCSTTFPGTFGACVVSLWSHRKCCHHSCLFFARKGIMISHACQSGSYPALNFSRLFKISLKKII